MIQDTSSGAATQNPQRTPDDRSTSFQAVEGGGETRSGTALMVEAYAVIWTILLVYLVLLWRKQASINRRIDGLEAAIDRVAKKKPQ